MSSFNEVLKNAKTLYDLIDKNYQEYKEYRIKGVSEIPKEQEDYFESRWVLAVEVEKLQTTLQELPKKRPMLKIRPDGTTDQDTLRDYLFKLRDWFETLNNVLGRPSKSCVEAEKNPFLKRIGSAPKNGE